MAKIKWVKVSIMRNRLGWIPNTLAKLWMRRQIDSDSAPSESESDSGKTGDHANTKPIMAGGTIAEDELNTVVSMV